MEPAVFSQHFRCFLRLFPVPFHHIVPADKEFAYRACHIGPFLFGQDFHLYTGKCGTRRQILRFLCRKYGNDRRSFSKTVTFLDRVAETFKEGLRHRLGKRSTAGYKSFHRCHILRLAAAGEQIVQRRHHDSQCHLMLTDGADNIRRIFRTEKNGCRMETERRQNDNGKTVTMEHGKHAENP